MRRLVAQHIKKGDFLIHCDMFDITKFPTEATVINCGLGESNAMNIAGGIASTGKTVWVYGVAGFLIHRLEQLKFSCLHFGAKTGKIIIVNAGRVGYGNLGIGHKLDDDISIMDMYNILSYKPYYLNDLQNIINNIEKEENGVFYIQLGKDVER